MRAIARVKQSESVQRYINNQQVRRVLYVPDRILNRVVSEQAFNESMIKFFELLWDGHLARLPADIELSQLWMEVHFLEPFSHLSRTFKNPISISLLLTSV